MNFMNNLYDLCDRRNYIKPEGLRQEYIKYIFTIKGGSMAETCWGLPLSVWEEEGGGLEWGWGGYAEKECSYFGIIHSLANLSCEPFMPLNPLRNSRHSHFFERTMLWAFFNKILIQWHFQRKFLFKDSRRFTS